MTGNAIKNFSRFLHWKVMILMQKIRFILFHSFTAVKSYYFQTIFFALNVVIAETIELIFALNKKHKICTSICWQYVCVCRLTTYNLFMRSIILFDQASANIFCIVHTIPSSYDFLVWRCLKMFSFPTGLMS